MNSISITQLKSKPSDVIASAQDYPVAVQKRNNTKAYIIGKELFEKIIMTLEDTEDKKSIKTINIRDKKDFEEFANELGI
jgi:prevent-host-death family protein